MASSEAGCDTSSHADATLYNVGRPRTRALHGKPIQGHLALLLDFVGAFSDAVVGVRKDTVRPTVLVLVHRHVRELALACSVAARVRVV